MSKGLSSAQISGDTSDGARIRYHRGGRLAQVHFDEDSRNASPGGKRAACTGFSRASRSALLKKLNSLNRYKVRRLPYFVTLTYPGQFPTDPTVWKRHLDNWRRTISDKIGKTCFIWKLELQKRGAPHFHLIMFADYDLRDLYGLISQTWYDSVGSGDTRHLAAGTRIERCKSWNGVISYAAKYVGKVEDLPEGSKLGRIWGVYGRDQLPVDPIEIQMLYHDAMLVRRTMRRYRGLRGDSQALGTSAFLSDEPLTALLWWLGYCVQPPKPPPDPKPTTKSKALRNPHRRSDKTLEARGYILSKKTGRYYRDFKAAR